LVLGTFVQSVQSAGFPIPYDHNLDTAWSINVGSGYIAVLRFINFTTELGYDFVAVSNQ